ncbi:MAG: RecX family transcriptional regulator [Spirochaetes bacterium]|nr:RecX family transcriptional regulator [Spirochaetota bacterium]
MRADGLRKKTKTPPPVYERALALAARRLRSTSDLRQKLLNEGYDGDAIEPALVRLKEVHLLDDARVAQAIGQHYKDRGNRFIAHKLKAKGLAVDEHTAALEELPDEFERALAVAEKKLHSLKALDARVVRQKLYQHLAARGFGGGVIEKVVRRVVSASS